MSTLQQSYCTSLLPILVLFIWLPQVSVSAAAASMRTVVVRLADADAAAYYIATADFIGLRQRNEQELTQNVDVAAGTCGNQTNSPIVCLLKPMHDSYQIEI